MKEDYYNTLIKDIIENNDKEKATEIIVNKLNKKQISNEKEILINIEKDKEIERLNNIIKEVREVIEERCQEEFGGIARYIKNILDKGE